MKRAAACTAVLAALLGAPSAVLAAPPNQLAEPQATPTRGTPLTPFHLSVRYVSSAGNAASGVTADLGVLEIPLLLSSGTPVDGTWSVTTLLPAGSWPLQFHASVLQGPSPSLEGPSLLVQGDDPSSSAPSPAPGADEPRPSATGDDHATDPTPGPAGSPAAEPNATSRPDATPDEPEPAPSGGRRGRAGGETAEPAPRDSDDGERAGRRRGDRPAASQTAAAPPGAGEGPLDGQPGGANRTDLLLVLAGIVSVATVTLLGTGWMLASRERDDRSSAGVPADEGPPSPTARERDPGGAARHAAHDPVLAAMGLDEPEETAGDPVRGRARGAAPRPKRPPQLRR